MERGQSELSVFGRRAVREALAAPRVEVLEVVASRALPGPFRSELAAHCRDREIPYRSASAQAVHDLSREPRHDQGIAARIRLLSVMEVESFVAECTGAGARSPAHILALDGITNPQNVGMIARSALAAGFRGLLWPLTGTPWVEGLSIKASAGAIFRLPLVRCEDLPTGLAPLRAAGFEIAGLASQRGESLFDFKPPHRGVFVVGSETEGVSDSVAELVDRWLHIPIDPQVESLNVAVASALVCFHCTRQSQ